MNKKNLQMLVLSLLLLFLLLLESCLQTGMAVHVVSALCFVLLTAWHILLSRLKFEKLYRRPNILNTLNLILDVLLVFNVLALFITGLISIGFIFRQAREDAVLYHFLLSSWMLVFAGLHAGMHISDLRRWLEKRMPYFKTAAGRGILLLLGASAALFGYVLFQNLGIMEYLAARRIHPLADYSKDLTVVFLENFSLFAFYSWIGAVFQLLVRSLFSRRRQK